MILQRSKLSPAPWSVGPPPAYEVLDAVGDPVNQKAFRADMECEAMTRNAFDIMMRRGCGVCVFSGPGPHPGGVDYSWIVVDAAGQPIGGPDFPSFSDPVSAVLEADRWLKEQEANDV